MVAMSSLLNPILATERGPNLYRIGKKEDFMVDPVDGVITLRDNAIYFITSTVDLMGDRIVCGENTTIMGGSPYSSILKSTGLTEDSLLTSVYSLIIKDIQLQGSNTIDIAPNLFHSIINCIGVYNTSEFAQYYMHDNTQVTAINNIGEFEKVAGNTTQGIFIQGFDASVNNRASYIGALRNFYKINISARLDAPAGKTISMRPGKNGSSISSGEVTIVSGANPVNIFSQTLIDLSNSGYIEVFITNKTDATDITVIDLNVIIEKLN